jgi:hypothetical protein
MFLLRKTLGHLFPEAEFLGKQESLLGTLDALFERLEPESNLLAGLPSADRRAVDRALRFGRDQVRLHEAGGCANPASPIAESFVRKIEGRLEEMGLRGEAREWRGLCAEGAHLVRLEVAGDRQDARFVEDEVGMERLIEILRLVDPDSGRSESLIRFVRGERVLTRSIRDDVLTTSETRVSLYDGIERLPFDFQDRFQQEFRISPFLDRDGFVCAVLSKFLVSRAIPHSVEMHGTMLFQGLEKVLQGLVPQPLQAFTEWFFGSARGNGVTT